MHVAGVDLQRQSACSHATAEGSRRKEIRKEVTYAETELPQLVPQQQQEGAIDPQSMSHLLVSQSCSVGVRAQRA